MTTSLILSGVLLGVAWLWLRFAKREVSLPVWSTLEIPELAEAELPFVSIIVAACDQGHDLERCVQSLLRQDYSRFEVIVVDSASSDATWKRLLEMETTAEGHLRALRDELSPPGSLKRPAALQRGMGVARGEWVLFTTPATYHAPVLLSRAIAYAMLQGLGTLSLAPRHECRTFWGHVWHPLAFQYLAFTWPLEQVGTVARKVWACEAFLLVSREAYRKAGGHAAVASERHEAGPLMHRVKSLGYRVEFVKAMDLLQIRAYRRLRELWDYWSQDLYILLGARPLQVAAHAVSLVLWAVLPFVALIPAFSFGFWGLDTMRGWWDIVFAICAILAVVTILQAESVVRRVHRQNHFYTATLPLGGLCLAVAAVSGLLREALWRMPAVKGMGRSGPAPARPNKR
ncbi:MAG TPA: glycosyltransferase family 2 protein [Candidatus Tectomicrobia bacterium]|nr:glycosyltransferase family 2 protein [Candidatus Tectomicrobia bacterium]